MFRFKDIFYGFIASASIGGIAVVTIVAALGAGMKLAMLSMILWFILCIFMFGKLANNRLGKLADLLNECHVSEFVEEYDRIEERASGKEGKRFVVMNKARGLIALGAVDEALRDLKEVDIPEKHKPKEMHLLALFHMILFNAWVEKGDLDKAIKALSVCKYMISDTLYKEPYLSNMMELVKRADARLALAQGEFDGLEERYWEITRGSVTPLDKVMAHYRLAEIAEHFGNEEDRTEHLEYVSENGGSTIYKFLADLALQGSAVQDKAINEGFIDVEEE